MKYIILVITLTLALPLSAQDVAEEAQPGTTQYYFIRHAEKDRSDPANKDPNLIQQGVFRAARWSYIFEQVSFDAVYSTDYNRTRQTAGPTAEMNQVSVTIYDPRNIDIAGFLEETRGKTVLIVGHSNSTPTFVNAVLGAEKYPQIDDSNNAHLYVVTISGQGEISDTLLIIE